MLCLFHHAEVVLDSCVVTGVCRCKSVEQLAHDYVWVVLALQFGTSTASGAAALGKKLLQDGGGGGGRSAGGASFANNPTRVQSATADSIAKAVNSGGSLSTTNGAGGVGATQANALSTTPTNPAVSSGVLYYSIMHVSLVTYCV